MMEVRTERSHWRDQALSERHRHWGVDCPATDLDFLMVEYDRGEARAIVDYKHERAEPVQLMHPSYCAMRELCHGCSIPLVVTYYRRGPFRFLAIPANDHAVRTLGDLARSLSERQWVAVLYGLRGRPIPTLNPDPSLGEDIDPLQSWDRMATLAWPADMPYRPMERA